MMIDTTANVRRALNASEHFNALRKVLPSFQYLTDDYQLLYSIPAGDGWLHVIGHPEWASYEWVYATDFPLAHIQRSDDGWGGCDCAMQAGLNAILG